MDKMSILMSSISLIRIFRATNLVPKLAPDLSSFKEGLVTLPTCAFMDDQKQSESQSSSSSLEPLAAVMVHIVALGLPAFIIWNAQPGSSLFSWHPTLMALGFGFLMVEAIMLFSPQSSLIQSAARATKIKFHWITQLLAIACSIGGFAAIYYNKDRRNKPHFTTLHSWFGLCTMGLVILQAFQGLTVFYPKISPIARRMKLSQVKQLHAVCGAFIFFIACATVMLGFCSNWFTRTVDNNVIVFFSVMSVLALGGIVIGQVFTEYGMKRKPGT